MHACADLRSKAQDDVLWDPTEALGSFLNAAQRVALDPLHHDVKHIVLLAEVEDLDDVWMSDPRGHTGLVEEHRFEFRIIRDVRQHRLDRDDLLKAASALQTRCPNGRHAALRDTHQDFVPTQRATRLEFVQSGRLVRRAGHRRIFALTRRCRRMTLRRVRRNRHLCLRRGRLDR